MKSKQAFCSPWQATIYTSVVHFLFPCASRNLVTDLKQVKGAICEYIESPCLIEDFVTTSKNSLCLRLEETVSFLGRSECLVCFRCTTKTKSLAFVRPIPSPQKTVDHPRGVKSCITWTEEVCSASLDSSPFTDIVQMTLKSLYLRQLYLGYGKAKD